MIDETIKPSLVVKSREEGSPIDAESSGIVEENVLGAAAPRLSE